jgi:uncharacterized protein
MNLSPANHTADDIIRLLDLAPLSNEGGFFRRTAEASSSVQTARGQRLGWSMILALFTPAQFSALHRVAADELWCFVAGDALELFLLTSQQPESVQLGLSPGDRLQQAVPAGVWQGARVTAGGAWSLVSCVVVPGFHWDDFELGERAKLQAEFPRVRDLIRQLTR